MSSRTGCVAMPGMMADAAEGAPSVHRPLSRRPATGGRAPAASRAARGWRGDRRVPAGRRPQTSWSEHLWVGLDLGWDRVAVELGGVGPGDPPDVLGGEVADLPFDHRLGIGPRGVAVRV